MNSINWLEAYLGILRAGALALPLNHRFTIQDGKYCLDAVESKAIILDEPFTDQIEVVLGQFNSVWSGSCIVVGEEVPSAMERFEDLIAQSPSGPVCNLFYLWNNRTTQTHTPHS